MNQGSPGDGAEITIHTDVSRMDGAIIHGFLSRSYWAEGIPPDVVARSMENSLCFGVFDGDRQVGFARVVTDRATFAYLADVFILESHRGLGLSHRLMDAVLAHPDLQGLRRWMLATRDAHGLYAMHGFTPVAAPDRFMEIHRPEIYTRSAGS